MDSLKATARDYRSCSLPATDHLKRYPPPPPLFPQVLGTEELFAYLDHYDLELDPQFDGLIGRHAKKPWSKFITSENQQLCQVESSRSLVFLFPV